MATPGRSARRDASFLAELRIASPITVLLGEQSALEVLVLTYTLNLTFWERHALGIARALGARVTVVADAHSVSIDTSSVRYAGTTYLDGRAACRAGGAFHPKLLVIAGEEQATVAIGSGNATIPGWHGNAELWTVLHGDRAAAPRALVAVADWLRGLPAAVELTPGVELAFGRVADRLDSLPPVEIGPRLITSLDQPIIEQLPDGPVDSLTIAAPFHDPASVALDLLATRLRPGRLDVLVQPGQSQLDGNMLASILTKHRGQAYAIASERYHHGKLYEWVAGRERYALTGSPNLSGAALLTPMRNGGNCELALLERVEESLAPPVGPPITEQLPRIVYRYEQEPGLAVVLLGATLLSEGLRLRLLRPLTAAAQLQTLADDVWTSLLAVPAGEQEPTLAPPVNPGLPVRILLADGRNSNVVFVTDPSRVLRVRVHHEGRVRTDENGVFEQARIAEAFYADIVSLREFLSARAAAPRGPIDETGGSDRQPKPVSLQSWEEYLDACAAKIGEPALYFALGLPSLATQTGRGADEGFFGELEDETGEPDPDNDTEPPTAPNLRHHSLDQKRRYRQWCDKLAQISPDLPPAGRLLALRLILRACAGGLWESSDDWLPIVAAAVEALGRPAEAFDQERPAVATLAAVGLAVAHGAVHSFAEWDEGRIHYQDALNSVFDLLLDIDQDLLERYTADLTEGLGHAINPTAINALIESLLESDPIDETIDVLETEFGISAKRNKRVIEFLDPSPGDARFPLLRAVGLATRGAPVAAHGRSHDGTSTAVIWNPPNLVILRKVEGALTGRLFEIRGVSPVVYAAIDEPLPQDKAWWKYPDVPPAAAAAALESVNLRFEPGVLS